MRFVLYSEKTVAQCLTAINARMHAKATSTHPALDGWVEKGGAFSLSLSAPVIGKFTRRTVLKARIEREGGVTIIDGSVPHGVARQGQAIIYVALVLVALTIIGGGNVLVGLLLLPFGAYLYIPMHGDYVNSALLIDEVEKTLKAKPKPPKKATAETKPAKSTTTSLRPVAAKRSTVSKSISASKPASASKSLAVSKPTAVSKPKPAPVKSPLGDTVPSTAAPADTDLADASEFPPMSEE